MNHTSITAAEFDALEGLDDWRFHLGAIHATFSAPSFPAGAALVGAIADAAEQAVHHPDVELTYPGRVHVALTTHATGGLTTLDVELARKISTLASDLDASSDPLRTQSLEVAIDTMDPDRIRGFWAAVLDYGVAADGSLLDPRRDRPVILVSADGRAAIGAKPLPHRHQRSARRRRDTRCCGAGGRWPVGHRRVRPSVLGARRRRRQRGLRVHVAGPQLTPTCCRNRLWDTARPVVRFSTANEAVTNGTVRTLHMECGHHTP